MAKGYLEPGKIFDWHKHDNLDEFFLVIKGHGIIEYSDGTHFEFKPDDLIYSPSNLDHKITNTGDEQCEFYFIRLNH